MHPGLALQAHVLRSVAFNHGLDISRQPPPESKVGHQVEARPHVVGHGHVFLYFVELEYLRDGQGIFLSIDLAVFEPS